MNLLKAKRAVSGTDYLSIWLFIIFAIIGVSIFVGIIIFTSAQVDSRAAEANLLSDKLAECLQNKFDYEEFTNATFDIYAKCNFNKKVLENTDLYYFSITAKDIASEASYSLSKGNGIFAVQCALSQEENNFPRCLSKNILVVDYKTNKQYSLSILAASNQR